jgi:hypothetical protein
MMRLTRQHLEGIGLGLARCIGNRCRGRAHLVQHQLHPQLAGLVLDDEQHLVMGGRQRVLGRENLVQMQIVAIAHVTAEVELGFLVADDGCAAMQGAAGGFIRHGQIIFDRSVRAA